MVVIPVSLLTYLANDPALTTVA